MDNWINLNIMLDGYKQDLKYIDKQINEAPVYPTELFKKRDKIIDKISELEYEVETIRMRYIGKGE